eukprot:CAMPEP_0198137330 /NCGR_PEP_ID=MMETSP1443-20131203/851_1 /TAXON_ID=186043 /ORGANISM="Entomoneis sp., Strain CCMP2396" /LENGTH=57 /DNA_ID=CAMNT_0043798731 /DNA_START=118 /DNA_END=288 /DNA_ORIENTATION=-
MRFTRDLHLAQQQVIPDEQVISDEQVIPDEQVISDEGRSRHWSWSKRNQPFFPKVHV